MTETVHCDVGDLVNLPVDAMLASGDVPLEGSDAQVRWADAIRAEKLDEWEADLPDDVFNAVCSIRDATWWIANKEADTSEVKWPKAWTKQQIKPIGHNGPPPATRPAPPPPPRAGNKVMEAARNVRPEHLNNFDQFARTMCKSPELAYLAIMAMAVRQNPTDASVRAKYDEVRATIQGHLNAIDKIAKGE